MTQRDTPPGVTPLAEEVELVQSASRSVIRGLDEAVVWARRGIYFRKFYASPTGAREYLAQAYLGLEVGMVGSVATWWEFGPHARFVIAWRRA